MVKFTPIERGFYDQELKVCCVWCVSATPEQRSWQRVPDSYQTNLFHPGLERLRQLCCHPAASNPNQARQKRAQSTAPSPRSTVPPRSSTGSARHRRQGGNSGHPQGARPRVAPIFKQSRLTSAVKQWAEGQGNHPEEHHVVSLIAWRDIMMGKMKTELSALEVHPVFCELGCCNPNCSVRQDQKRVADCAVTAVANSLALVHKLVSGWKHRDITGELFAVDCNGNRRWAAYCTVCTEVSTPCQCRVPCLTTIPLGRPARS